MVTLAVIPEAPLGPLGADLRSPLPLARREARRGREEGSKERPCAVALALRREGGGTTVVVAPITHSPPRDAHSGVEIPAAAKPRRGLDEAAS